MKKITTITSSVLLLSVLGCSEQESSQTYVDKAKQSLSENKVNESVIELKNAIKIDTKNAEARYILGQTYLSQGQGLEAAKEFERALGLKFDKNQVIPLLARSYLISRQNGEIVDLADKAKTLEPTSKSSFLLYLVIAQLTDNDLDSAKVSLEQLETISGNPFSIIAAQAYVKFAEQDFETANQLLAKALEIEPQNPEAILLKAKLGSVTQDFSTASEAYSDYLKIQPASLETELMLASSLMSEQKLDEAVKHANRIIKLIPSQPFANFVKAMEAMEAKDYGKASEYAETAIQNNMNQPNVRLVAGVSAFYLKNYEQVQYHLSSLVNYLPADHFARRMLAVSQVELGVIDDLGNTLQGFEAKSEQDAQFISSLSYKLIQAGATNEAQQLVDKSKNVNSTDATQLLREGVLKMMLNDPTAVDHLSEAINQDPDLTNAELAMAYLAVKDKEFDKANEIAENWKTKYPEKPDGYNLSAAIKIEQKQYADAKADLNKSLSLDENNVFALLHLVNISVEEGDLEQAKTIINDTVKVHPSSPRVLRQNFQLNRSEQALELIKAQHQQAPEDFIYRLLYAESLAHLLKYDDVIKVLNGYTPTNKTPKLYWNIRLAAYRALQDVQNVQLLLEEWRKTSPYHIEPIVLLTDFHTARRNYDNATRTVKNGLVQHPDNLTLKLVHTYVLIAAQRPEEASRAYQKIASDINVPEVKMEVLGRIALLEQRFPEAVTQLNALYKAKPTDRNIVYLIGAYTGAEKFEGAIKTLKKHLEEFGDKPLLNNALADLYLKMSDQDKALTVYQQMLEQGSDNVIVLNNAAWISLEKGKLDQANKFAKRAFELAPDIPDIVDTYSQVLFKQGKKREALQKSKQAYELSNGKKTEIALNYGEILLALGRKNEAKTVIEQISPLNTTQKSRQAKLSAEL